MKRQTKVFAMYLPQYHVIPENSKFWGEGFTDWVSVRKSTPLFQGHNQPKIPINNYYYDLSNVDDIRKQVNCANKYGLNGWGIYHYWFDKSHNLLSRPAEILLENNDLNIGFFFAWDNTSWKRTWSKIQGNDWAPIQDDKTKKGKEPEILVEYSLGNQTDWKIHFDYLLPFFKDKRYEKHDNKPIVVIMRYSDDVLKMEKYWNELAKIEGFNGIEVIYSYNPFHGIPKNVHKFTYEPLYSGWGTLWDRIKRFLVRHNVQKQVKTYDYDITWKRIIKHAKGCKRKELYYGAFVNYDDTPRRGKKGKVILGGSPEKFGVYLRELIKISEEQGKKYIFLTAWNEWGEGAILEPDEENEYRYLEEYKRSQMVK